MTSKVGSTKFDDAINEYYKLKQKYDLSIQKEVRKIRSLPDLNVKEKQEKFSEMKKRCVNCGKSGGTIFRQEGVNLIAQCGNTDSQCKLNIHLQRAKYLPMNTTISILNSEINNKKAEIIKTKLNFLFGFASESKTVATFNQLKSDLIKEVKKYQKINEKYISIIEDLPNKDIISRLNTNLQTTIQSFKNFINQFDETGETQYIKDAGTLYVEHIVKIAQELQSFKYIIQYIYSAPDNTHHLIQKTYKSSELEVVVPGTENKILAFTK